MKTKIIKILDKIVKKNSLSFSLMDYIIIEESNKECPFCNCPQWVVLFRFEHKWSNNTVDYSTCKVMIHNFVETGDIIEFSKNINIREVNIFISIASQFCKEFNK